MNHRGAKHTDSDYFDDVMEEGTEGEKGGILGGAGLNDYDQIHTSVNPEGVKVRLNCWACNKAENVVLEWPEVITLGENEQGARPVLPQGWQFSQNNNDAYVSIKCPRCGHDEGFSVHVTPEEARKHVQQGLNAGFINPQQIAGVQQKVQVYRQQQRRG